MPSPQATCARRRCVASMTRFASTTAYRVSRPDGHRPYDTRPAVVRPRAPWGKGAPGYLCADSSTFCGWQFLLRPHSQHRSTLPPPPPSFTGHRGPAVRCQPGHGRRTSGGGGNKVSHIGWPAVTGILWIVREANQRPGDIGTELNDELLGSTAATSSAAAPATTSCGATSCRPATTMAARPHRRRLGQRLDLLQPRPQRHQGRRRQRSHLGPLRPRHDRLRQRLGRRPHQAPLDVQADVTASAT